MSNETEKNEAIEASVKSALKRLKRIDALKSVGASNKAYEYERDMLLELIQRGEALLGKKVSE
jgi:hypothetical protein